jgi:hypothetical protein
MDNKEEKTEKSRQPTPRPTHDHTKISGDIV